MFLSNLTDLGFSFLSSVEDFDFFDFDFDFDFDSVDFDSTAQLSSKKLSLK